MDAPKVMAVRLALKKMFKDDYFSIVTVKDCIRLTEIIPDKETLDIMAAIHCVKYSEMEPEFRQWLFNSVLDMFEHGDRFKLEFIDHLKIEAEDVVISETFRLQ